MRRHTLLCLAAALALAGCSGSANLNVENHKSALRGAGAVRYDGRATVLPASASPHEDILRMFEQGYGLIEHVTYTGSDDPTSTAISYARDIGASHVIISSRHKQTRKEIDPGLAAASPLMAVMFQRTVVYNDNTAFYFAPLERKGLGIFVVDLTQDNRGWLPAASDIRNGVIVTAVRPGSPGRAADLRPGDIVVQADDKEVLDREGLGIALGQVHGEHTFKVVRGGETMDKRVTVPLGW